MRSPPFFCLVLLSAGLLPACTGGAFSAASGDGGEADTSVEGGADGGADAASWCHQAPQTLATFCEDFDEFANVDDYSHAVASFAQQGGTLSFPAPPLDGTPSLPNALLAQTTVDKGVDALSVVALPAPKKTPVSRRLEFDLHVNEVSGIQDGNAVGFAALLFGDTPGAGTVALAFGPPGSGSTDTGTLSAVYIEPPDAGPLGFGAANSNFSLPTAGVWDGRLALEILYGLDDAGMPSACVQAYLSGNPQLGSGCPLRLPADLLAPAHVNLALGVFSGGLANATGTVALAFDNVTYSEL